jgi:hypothetical protein
MFTATKTLANGHRLTVTVRLPAETEAPCTPAFSVTAEEIDPRYKGDRRFVAGGCMHAEILAHWPHLADVVALHGSDADGTPMHAEANGWYWLAGAVAGNLGERYHGGNGSSPKTFLECRAILRDHLRLSEREVADMINTTHTIAKQESAEAARANFRLWIGDLAPRWKAQADAAIAKYASK